MSSLNFSSDRTLAAARNWSSVSEISSLFCVFFTLIVTLIFFVSGFLASAGSNRSMSRSSSLQSCATSLHRLYTGTIAATSIVSTSSASVEFVCCSEAFAFSSSSIRFAIAASSPPPPPSPPPPAMARVSTASWNASKTESMSGSASGFLPGVLKSIISVPMATQSYGANATRSPLPTYLPFKNVSPAPPIRIKLPSSNGSTEQWSRLSEKDGGEQSHLGPNVVVSASLRM
mmetsp:Transcript_9286/g.21947  ORF Transcript_9286/g.21947 Transcript_9286/m.21947 type:complete len:231 (-) Transcript_9286:1773-2465(-)